MSSFYDWCVITASCMLCTIRTQPYETNIAGNTMSTSAAVVENEFRADRAWWERVFATIDAGDAAGFVEFLTPDAQFRFGNAPAISGAGAIRAAVSGFFAAIGSSRHELLGTWRGPMTAVCEGEVTYTRHDGSVLRVPFVNVFDLCGERIAACRTYIDNSALFNSPV
jgi:ketosteroid isomerase-like protein